MAEVKSEKWLYSVCSGNFQVHSFGPALKHTTDIMKKPRATIEWDGRNNIKPWNFSQSYWQQESINTMRSSQHSWIIEGEGFVERFTRTKINFTVTEHIQTANPQIPLMPQWFVNSHAPFYHRCKKEQQSKGTKQTRSLEFFFHQAPGKFLDECHSICNFTPVLTYSNHIHRSGFSNNVILGTTECNQVFLVNIFNDVGVTIQHKAVTIVGSFKVSIQFLQSKRIKWSKPWSDMSIKVMTNKLITNLKTQKFRQQGAWSTQGSVACTWDECSTCMAKSSGLKCIDSMATA